MPPSNLNVLARIREFRLLSKAGGLHAVIDKRVDQKHPRASRGLEINKKRNAVTNLTSLRNGTFSGSQESPASIAEKIRAGDANLELYEETFKANLHALGYGPVLKRRGLQKALEQFYAEYDLALKKTGKK